MLQQIRGRPTALALGTLSLVLMLFLTLSSASPPPQALAQNGPMPTVAQFTPVVTATPSATMTPAPRDIDVSVSLSDYVATTQDEAITVTVELSQSTIEEVRVGYTTAPGTAQPELDYTPTSGVLVFAPGETQRTVVIPILPDGLAENDETFRFFLSNPQGPAVLAFPRSATITLVDLPTARFVASAATFNETDEDAFVDVELSAPATQDVQLSYTISASPLPPTLTGTTRLAAPALSLLSGGPPTEPDQTTLAEATPGEDFQAKTSTLVFAPGEMRQRVTLRILDDDAEEPDETFYVFLTDAQYLDRGAQDVPLQLGTPNPMAITIRDDDILPPPSPGGHVQFRDATTLVKKLPSRTVRIPIIRTGVASTFTSVTCDIERISFVQLEPTIDTEPFPQQILFVPDQRVQYCEVPVSSQRRLADVRARLVLRQGASGFLPTIGPRATMELIVRSEDLRELSSLTTAPVALAGQPHLFQAHLPSSTGYSVRLLNSDQRLDMYDDGTNGDVAANDGIYTRWHRFDEIGTEQVQLFGESGIGEPLDITVISDPDLLILTDWDALYQEFRATGMRWWREDFNDNTVHDFRDLAARIGEYAAQHRGVVIDISQSITTDDGFATDYADLDYGDGFGTRRQQGMLIDQLIENLARQTGDSFRNVAIIGDDAVVPFSRVSDPVDYTRKYNVSAPNAWSDERFYPEREFGDTGDSAVLADVQRATILSDMPYSIRAAQSLDGTAWMPNIPAAAALPEPDMGIGRIFAARPLDLIRAIDRYEKPLQVSSAGGSAAAFLGDAPGIDLTTLFTRSQLSALTDQFGDVPVFDAQTQPWKAKDFATALETNSLVSIISAGNHRSRVISGTRAINASDVSELASNQPVLLVSLGARGGLSESAAPDTSEQPAVYDDTISNVLVGQGVTLLGQTGAAYFYDTATGTPLGITEPNLQELLTSNAIERVLGGVSPTMGTLWQEIFPSFHHTDPPFLINDNPATHLFHAASSYSTVLYGLPTQPIARRGVQAAQLADAEAAPANSADLGIVTFTQERQRVREDAGRITVSLNREGSENARIVDYRYTPLSANREEDFLLVPANQKFGGEVVFTPGASTAALEIDIIDDAIAGECDEVLELETFEVDVPSTMILIIEDNDTASCNEFAISTPNVLHGQGVTFFADTRQQDVDRVAIELSGGDRLQLRDDGQGADIVANDGIYSVATSDLAATNAQNYRVRLFVDEVEQLQRTVNVLDNPRLLILTDWRELYRELQDGAMRDGDTDRNGNTLHDFYELVRLVHDYAAEHDGIVVDVAQAIPGYAALDYGDLEQRHEKGHRIDQLLADICTSGQGARCEDIFILGNDQVVPFYRVTNPMNAYSESNPENEYATGASAAVLQDIQNGFVLSDIPYSMRSVQTITANLWEHACLPTVRGTTTPAPLECQPEPDLGIGRLFAPHPVDLLHSINLNNTQPLNVSPDSARAALFDSAPNEPEYRDRYDGWFADQLVLRGPNEWTPPNLTTAFAEHQVISVSEHATHEAIGEGPSRFTANDARGGPFDSPVLFSANACNLGLGVSSYPDNTEQSTLQDSLVYALVGRGVSVFAATNYAYSVDIAETPDVEATFHKKLISLYMSKLIEPEGDDITTLGDLWQPIYRLYHQNDPALLNINNDAIHLPHAAGSYGMVFYGLPTQQIQRAGPPPESAISCIPRDAAVPLPQEPVELTMTLDVPQVQRREQDGGDSILSLPHAQAHIGTGGEPLLPMMIRTAYLPDGVTAQLRAVEIITRSERIAVEQLATGQLVSANADRLTDTVDLPPLYPIERYQYRTPRFQDRQLVLSFVPVVYDRAEGSVAVTEQATFTFDLITQGDRPSGYVIADPGLVQEVAIHEDTAQVAFDIRSNPDPQVHLRWRITNAAGAVIEAGAEAFPGQGTAQQCMLSFDTQNWRPGTKDVSVYLMRDERVLTSATIPLRATGLSLRDDAGRLTLNPLAQQAELRLRLIDQDGAPVTTAATFTVSGVGPTGLQGIQSDDMTPTNDIYDIRVPLASIPPSSTRLRVEAEVADLRGQREWRLNEDATEMFLPLVTR